MWDPECVFLPNGIGMRTAICEGRRLNSLLRLVQRMVEQRRLSSYG